MAQFPPQADSDAIDKKFKTFFTPPDMISQWLSKRKGLRVSATKTCNTLQTKLADEAGATAVVGKLTKLIGDLTLADDTIHNLVLQSGKYDDNDYQADLAVCETYSDNLDLALAQANLALKSLQRQNAAQAGASSQVQGGPNTITGSGGPPQNFNAMMSYPKLELPIYTGKKVFYPKFIKEFEAAMDKTNYSEYQKYLLLLQSLHDEEAKATAKDPGIHNMTYTAAKAELEAICNDNDQRDAVIAELLNLKLEKGKPRAWLTDAKALKDLAVDLNLTVDHFIRFFLWRGLPKNYQRELVFSTRTDHPDLAAIFSKFGNVAKHIQTFEPASTLATKEQTVTLATTVKVSTLLKVV